MPPAHMARSGSSRGFPCQIPERARSPPAVHRRESAAAKPPPSEFSGPRSGLVMVTGASLGRVGAEQGLAVAAAEQEDEPLQVAAQLGQAVGGVADELCQGVAQAGGVAGQPLAEELQQLGELGRVDGRSSAVLKRSPCTAAGVPGAARSRSPPAAPPATPSRTRPRTPPWCLLAGRRSPTGSASPRWARCGLRAPRHPGRLHRTDPRGIRPAPAPVCQLVPAEPLAPVPGPPRRHRVLRP